MEVVTVSSKGQVVLPVSIRNRLSLCEGDRLAAFASDDVIMLKVLRMPTAEDFKSNLDQAQQWAASVGYTEADVESIVKSSRKRRRK